MHAVEIADGDHSALKGLRQALRIFEDGKTGDGKGF
jgi:hypothetical protein